MSPCITWGHVNCLCPGSDDGIMMGKREGGSKQFYQTSLQRQTGASRLAKVSGLHTHTHTHLLSQRFRNYRLRPDHPQEGKQALISALQGPALSPGLSPLHTCYMHGTHRFFNHLTSFSISPEILPQKFADQSRHFHADCKVMHPVFAGEEQRI